MRKTLIQISILIILPLLFSCEKDKNEIAEDIYNTWEVVDFMSIESVLYAKNNGFNPTIEFKRDGSISVRLDANSCFGNFEIAEGDAIEIGELGCTKICCDSDFSNKFSIMLSRVESYSIEENNLKLNISDWGWINLKLQ